MSPDLTMYVAIADGTQVVFNVDVELLKVGAGHCGTLRTSPTLMALGLVIWGLASRSD